jgi:hypothetical protein
VLCVACCLFKKTLNYKFLFQIVDLFNTQSGFSPKQSVENSRYRANLFALTYCWYKMASRLQFEQLSHQQKLALAMTFLGKEVTQSNNKSNEFRLKQLLLRAYIIYKRRYQVEPSTLDKYKHDFKLRLQQYLAAQSCNSQSQYLLPNYLSLFLNEVYSANLSIFNQNDYHENATQSLMRSQDLLQQKIDDKLISFSLSYLPNLNLPNLNFLKLFVINRKLSYHYHITWAKLCLAISTNHAVTVKLKKRYGCISLIPITIRNEHIKIRNVCIHYHDLCHLEVAQLERIQMGKYMVSGIHGLKAKVFHDLPNIPEYDGFFDEARIAIHEWLTRPTIFSCAKFICWMGLLILYGINPLSVTIRHIRSIKKQQQEMCRYLTSN